MERKKDLRRFRDLEVYQRSFQAAMKILELTKKSPSDERFSMVDQIRRSSRSVCSNLAEPWRKRRYRAVFVSKVTDSMSEGSETQTWLEFSYACKFISQDVFKEPGNEYETILSMLNSVEKNAGKFCF